MQPGASEDILEDTHAVSEALQEVVRSECRKLVALLKERWGDAQFFASLYATGNWEFDGYPLTEEAIGEIVDYDLTVSKQRAWDWSYGDGSLS